MPTAAGTGAIPSEPPAVEAAGVGATPRPLFPPKVAAVGIADRADTAERVYWILSFAPEVTRDENKMREIETILKRAESASKGGILSKETRSEIAEVVKRGGRRRTKRKHFRKRTSRRH